MKADFRIIAIKTLRITAIVVLGIVALCYIYEYCLNDYTDYMFNSISDDDSRHYNITYYRATMFLYSVYFTLLFLLALFSKKIDKFLLLTLILLLIGLLALFLYYENANIPIWVLYFYNIFH